MQPGETGIEDFATQQSQQIGWTVRDADGDNNYWGFYDFGANPSQTLNTTLNTALNAQGRVAISSSWSGSALTPDNYLISPAISLANIPTNSNSVSLSFKVGSTQSSTLYVADYLSVYVVSDTTSNSVINATTPVHSAVLSQVGVSTFTYDISAHGGQTIYLVFRHHNCTNQGDLILDDISVVKAAGVGLTENGLVEKIYPNPVNNVLTVELNDVISKISITGIDGKLIEQKEVNSKVVTIDATNYSNGTYVYAIESMSGKIYRNSFIKN